MSEKRRSENWELLENQTTSLLCGIIMKSWRCYHYHLCILAPQGGVREWDKNMCTLLSEIV